VPLLQISSIYGAHSLIHRVCSIALMQLLWNGNFKQKVLLQWSH